MQVYSHLRVLLLYTALILVMTLPVGLHLTTQIAGQGGDPWQAMWRFTVKEQAGFTGFMQDILGQGDPQLVNLSVWPWMPIHAIFGEPLGYNVIFLLNFLLSGYAMALFVYMLTRSRSITSPAPLIAGIAYMFAPYHIAHSLGHFGAMQLEWLPFILATALSCIRNQKIWKVILLGILVSIQSWEEHHYIVWLAIFTLIAGIVYWKPLCERFKEEKGMWTVSSLAFLVVVIVGVIVPYIPTLKLASSDSTALALGTEQTIRFSADIFSFITPAPWHPLWGAITNSLFGQYFTGNEAESVQYLGIPILIAILFFHKHIPKRQFWLWLSVGIVFCIFSLGPVLHVFGHITKLTLPYAAIANLPVFSAIRTVARAGVFVTLASSVLFGWVIATNQHRMRTSYVIVGIILLDFLFVPFPTQSAILSPAYNMLANVQGKNIIEIPAATNYVAASRSLFAQTVDNKEALGNIALERGQSADALDFIKNTPGIRQLLYVRTTELTQDRPEFFQQDLRETLMESMKWLQTSAIMIHTDSITASQKEALASFLVSMDVFEKKSFGDVDVYTFREQASYHTDGVFLVRGDGFENVGYDPKRQSTFAEVPATAHATIINTTAQPIPVHITFTIPSESQSEITLQDGGGIVIPMQGNGLERSFSYTAPVGESDLRFVSTAGNRAIIQNPVLQGRPANL